MKLSGEAGRTLRVVRSSEILLQAYTLKHSFGRQHRQRRCEQGSCPKGTGEDFRHRSQQAF